MSETHSLAWKTRLLLAQYAFATESKPIALFQGIKEGTSEIDSEILVQFEETLTDTIKSLLVYEKVLEDDYLVLSKDICTADIMNHGIPPESFTTNITVACMRYVKF